jgi:predicted DNA-binding transcriptional regulator YafY
MDIKAKLRPFYVAKMLYEQTDEEHYLTIAQIIDQLEEQYDISTSRRTVSDDIKAIQAFGIEIEVEQSTQNRYYLIGRRFDLPELKALIDAVESARFIPKVKSSALVAKLSSLASPFNASKLVRNVDVENRIKADNEKIYYIMESLNDAINDKKKVSFQYSTYNRNKERIAKHDGEVYVFSPYKMIWNGDYYYVVGYSEKYGSIGSFRVDRIVTTPQLLLEEQHEPPGDFDINIYLNSMFRMYNGDRKQVELINNKKSPIQDDYIEKYLVEKDLNLEATLDAEYAYRDADFVVIAAPTNYDSRKNYFDTSAVETVIKLVLQYNPNAVMVIKSTIPVGFTEYIRKKTGSKNIIFSPEFLRESKALYDNLYPSRIIVGTDKNDEHLVNAAQIFMRLLQEGAIKEDIETRIMGFTEAEAVKLFANT